MNTKENLDVEPGDKNVLYLGDISYEKASSRLGWLYECA